MVGGGLNCVYRAFLYTYQQQGDNNHAIGHRSNHSIHPVWHMGWSDNNDDREKVMKEYTYGFTRCDWCEEDKNCRGLEDYPGNVVLTICEDCEKEPQLHEGDREQMTNDEIVEYLNGGLDEFDSIIEEGRLSSVCVWAGYTPQGMDYHGHLHPHPHGSFYGPKTRGVYCSAPLDDNLDCTDPPQIPATREK